MFSSKILLALPLLTSFVTSAPSFQLPIFNKNPLGSGSAAADGDVIDLSKYTIGEILDYTLAHHDDEKRHTPPLKKLSWVVNRTESFKEFVHNPDISVTLFAPDDEALTPPSRRGPGHGHDHDHDHDHEHEEMMHMAAQGPHPFHTLTGTDFDGNDGDDNDDKDHEKKREAILKIVNAILYYHTGAQQYSKSELLDKQTLATSLNQTRDTDVAFRIRTAPRFELLPPPPSFDLSLNFYAKTRAGPAIQAKNGIIYLISAPLFPPLTPLDQLLAVPTFFSTLTSGIQLTELDRQIAPWIHHSHDHHSKLDAMLADKTHPMVLDVLQEVVEEVKASLAPSLPSKDDIKSFPLTVFAPSNRAFFKVPFEIKAFLFSPFGRPYLKKLLAFHVVPNVLFHSDYIVNATHKDATLAESISSSLPAGLERYVEAAGLGGGRGRGRQGQVKKQNGEHGKAGDKAEVAKYELATLLGNRKNESLAVNVYSYRLAFGKGPLVKRITVGRNDQDEHEYVHVTAGDATAWGGAIHVIGSLLSPYHPHEHDDHHHGHHHEHHGHHGHGHGHEDQVEYFKSLFA